MSLGRTPNRRLKNLYSRLGPEFDNFARRGNALIHQPIDLLLGGFFFDATSEHPDKRWVHYFAQPLYVPYDDIYWTWGSRIPINPSEGWSHMTQWIQHVDAGVLDETVDMLLQVGLPFLMPMLDLRRFYAAVSVSLQGVKSYRGYETLASTALLLDNPDGFRKHVQEAILASELEVLPPGEFIREDLGGGGVRFESGMQDFEVESVERLKVLRLLVDSGRTNDALAILRENRRISAEAIGVEDLLAPNIGN